MKERSRTDTLNQIIDEILSELPLKEQVALANMSETDAEVLQQVFGLYVLRKIGNEGEEYHSIMKELWKRLKETHKLRVVK